MLEYVKKAVVVEVVNKKNYKEWSNCQVPTYLLANDIWDIVESTTEPPKLLGTF